MLESFGLKGQVKWIKSIKGVVVAESPWMDNKVVSSSERGISLFLDRLASINDHSGNIAYADIGDDNTAVSASNTNLGNGLVRAQVSLTSRSGLYTEFRFFFADALTPDDTYLEFGMFVDGSVTVGSGQLFNRILFGTPFIKASGEDYTLVCRITGSV